MSAPLGLHTDLYELRMVDTYLEHGMLQTATFSLFARSSPARPWIVAAGLDLVLEVLAAFRFDEDQLDYLAAEGTPPRTIEWLRGLVPEGELWAVPEGTIVLGREPILEFTGPLPVAQLLETALLNAVHVDSLIATKAARCVLAASGTSVVDFGFRRAQGLETGIRAARAAYLGGVDATSNVAAGRRYGIPIVGTMAHSFVQAFDDERVAFAAFARDHPGTTLLVDTYDLDGGLRSAIAVAKGTPGAVRAVRVDSAPLLERCRRARTLLDDAGLHDVDVFASGGLDEAELAELVAADIPIDGFGVGTSLVVSSDQPALDLAYKLVEYAGAGRAKYSAGKRTLPGAKQVLRDGSPATDVLDVRDADRPGEPLLAPVWRDGEVLQVPDLAAARARCHEQVARLPAGWFVAGGSVHPPPVPRIGARLQALADEVEARELGRG